ncbi:MAG: penicillin-binding protein 2 [bacterium]|nr:penicillin-binding protein 2 [bacterium]
MPKDVRRRLRLIAGFVLLVGALFIWRLYDLQIRRSGEFVREANKQYIATVPDVYRRGNIYFTEKNGRQSAGATVNEGYLVSIAPGALDDKEKAYEAIAAITPLDRDTFMEKAEKEDDPYEEIADRMSERDALAIKKLDIPGLHIFREAWRYYPGKTLAAHVLGFVGWEGNTQSGRYGLESYYNDTLRRQDEDLYVNFFAELFTNLRETVFDRSAIEGGDLVLTIEPTVEGYLEKELAGVMEQWNSDHTGGIIMDPKTGAIYAMAVNPSFDLNQYNTVSDQRVYANPLVEDVREMGSIVKPLTMAAGLDAGVVTAETTYNDTGSVTLNGRTFSNYDGRGRGPGTTMQRVLNDSLNTGAAFVQGKLGKERFVEYMQKRFRLGEETGVDLPGERQGLMGNLTSKREIEYATASFGQGIAVTPINMATALATLANGGMTVTPHVVSEIRYESGRVKKVTQTPPEEVLKKETADEITRMLVEVVDKALLGGTVKIPEYSIAAKTGTAQLARPKELGGGYYDDRYLHTFFGYFPAYDPKFIVFLYTYYPKNGATFASHTLTLPFIHLTKFLLNYYNIPPDRDPNAVKGITLLR